jgi:hypothetical protein
VGVAQRELALKPDQEADGQRDGETDEKIKVVQAAPTRLLFAGHGIPRLKTKPVVISSDPSAQI